MIRTTLSVVAAASLALGFAASTAFAQGTAPAAPVTTPAVKAPAAKPAVKTAAPKVASACKGLAQDACGKIADCTWRAASTRKDNVAVKAHCRKKPDISKAQAAKAKKAAATAPAATTTQTAAAPKAPAKPKAVAKPPAAAAGAPKTQ